VAASIKLAESMGAALGTGLGGAIIAAGDEEGRRSDGIAVAFGLMAAIAIGCALLTPRMPEKRD
jgi:hypothetical protein